MNRPTFFFFLRNDTKLKFRFFLFFPCRSYFFFQQNQQVAAAAAQINEINKRLEDKDDLINSTRIQLAKAEENLSELNAEHNSVLEQLTQAVRFFFRYDVSIV